MLTRDLLTEDEEAAMCRDIERRLELPRGSVIGLDQLEMDDGFRYFGALMEGPADGADRLASALAGRLPDLLPDDFAVSAKGESIAIDTPHGSLILMAGMPLRLPLPPDTRLALALRMFAHTLTEHMTAATGSPWPSPDAAYDVRVDPGEAALWWEVPGSERLSPQPFDRAELGL